MSFHGKRVKLLSNAALIGAAFLLFFAGCKNGNKIKDVELKADTFHYVIYTDPSSDCLDCILKCLDTLKQIKEDESDSIYFFALQTEDTENFTNYIKNVCNSAEVLTMDKPLTIPHPSLLLVKNRSIYMYLFLSADPYEMQESLDEAIHFMSNFRQR